MTRSLPAALLLALSMAAMPAALAVAELQIQFFHHPIRAFGARGDAVDGRQCATHRRLLPARAIMVVCGK